MRRMGLAVTIAVFAATLFAAPAQATFHLIRIKEVFAGYPGLPNVQYVMLQAYEQDQNVTSPQKLRIYDATGATFDDFTFTGNQTNGANQMTILIATDEAEAYWTITDNLDMDPVIDPNGGAVCWAGGVDCASWGSFSGTPQSSAGTPFAALGGLDDPAGRAMQRRMDISGSTTVLNAADDTPHSSTSFVFAAPAPRNNAGTAGLNPSTTSPIASITSNPGTNTADTTPEFQFASTVGNPPPTTFECIVDSPGAGTVEEDLAFLPCTSPHSTAALAPGAHVFKVRALDGRGVAEPSQHSHSFTVLDTDPPDSTITGQPDDPTSNTTPTFTFTSDEAGSSFKCRIDSTMEADFQPCTSPHTVGPLTVDTHTFEVRATDVANNVETVPASYTFAVVVPSDPDITPPTSEIVVPVHGSTTRSALLTQLSGTANDPAGGATEIVSGVDVVEIALRMRLRNRRCYWWNGTRFTRGGCSTPVYVDATGTSSWTYDLSARLRRSRGRDAKVRDYLLISRATDGDLNEGPTDTATFGIR
jgi:hypothetical protein